MNSQTKSVKVKTDIFNGTKGIDRRNTRERISQRQISAKRREIATRI
jgi:hypothetical protein